MDWQVKSVGDWKVIGALSEKVFVDQHDRENGHRQAEDPKIHRFLVQNAEAAPAGFAVYRAHGTEAQLQIVGVLPEMRRQKAATALLARCEKVLTEKGIKRIHVNLSNHDNLLLSMLCKSGYRIVDARYIDAWEDVRIRLAKDLKPHRELRYALTEKCNFACLFCHNEGLGHGKRERFSDEQVLDVLIRAIELGHTDVTFTGGEPLLQKDRLHYLIDRFGCLVSPPDITLVTNASLLDTDTIQRLVDYPGNRKIHLSMHATDAPNFDKITRTFNKNHFARVVQNVQNASKSGLTVKVNHVVLRDLNHRKILEAIELARSLGASTIKFIELLVLPENPDDYRMYYDIDALQGDIETVANGPYKRSLRQNVYTHKQDGDFTIELARCTCAFGCSHCREIRDRTISSDLCYHPCFVRHKKQYEIRTPDRLERFLEIGNRIIDGYASKYKDSSPTLVQKEKYVPRKREFFMKIDSADKFRDYLKAQRFAQQAINQFHEEFYMPARSSEEWETFRRVLKISWDYHNESRVNLIYADHEYRYRPDSIIETSTRFLESSGPMVFDGLSRARHFLDRLDFRKFMELDWEIETWAQRDIMLNLAVDRDHATVKAYEPAENIDRIHRLLAGYPGEVKPLNEPLLMFMKQAYSKRAVDMDDSQTVSDRDKMETA